MSSAVVVGGGIAGLAAARELRRAGAEVTVLEAGTRWGGKLGQVLLRGDAYDSGAESVLARRPEALDLIADLGLADRLVHPSTARPQALVEGRARPLPPSVLGVPTNVDQLDGFLTPAGLARARQEPELPAPELSGDVGIGDYVQERFGAEVTDRLLEPLLGGVYAGQSRLLSFEAVSPALFARARTGGSLFGHAVALSGSPGAGPVFAGLVGGVATLVQALTTDLRKSGVALRRQTTVRELIRIGDGRYRLACGAVPTPEVLEADAVVLAVPAGPAGRLLAELSPVASAWAAIPYASVAVVTLVLQGAQLSGSGLLVPTGELPTIKALTYSSNKWDWVAERARGAWGADTAIVRASVGRHGEERLLQLDDQALLQRTYAEAAALPGWEGAGLVTGSVSRWGGALPQYHVGHRKLVTRLRSSLARLPGIAVCGAAVDGVGVAACLASASIAVAKVAEDLGASRSGG